MELRDKFLCIQKFSKISEKMHIMDKTVLGFQKFLHQNEGFFFFSILHKFFELPLYLLSSVTVVVTAGAAVEWPKCVAFLELLFE